MKELSNNTIWRLARRKWLRYSTDIWSAVAILIRWNAITPNNLAPIHFTIHHFMAIEQRSWAPFIYKWRKNATSWKKQMGFFTNLLNFEQQISFYSAYHHNRTNQIIHINCVPLIFLTASIWLSQISLGIGHKWISVADLLVISYVSYYILLEPFAGVWCKITFWSVVLLCSSTNRTRLRSSHLTTRRERKSIRLLCTFCIMDRAVYWPWRIRRPRPGSTR